MQQTTQNFCAFTVQREELASASEMSHTVNICNKSCSCQFLHTSVNNSQTLILLHTANILTHTRVRPCHPSEPHPGESLHRIPTGLMNWSLHIHLQVSLLATELFVCFIYSLGKYISNSIPKEFPRHSLCPFLCRPHS